MDFLSRAERIKLVILDVDGVLTDGSLSFSADGEYLKTFNSRDGLGISLLHKGGLKTAVITGRRSEIVSRRARELHITEVYQGASDKRAAYAELKAKYALQDEQIAYIGDDLIDLPVMVQVGLACAVSDAAAEVKSQAAYVTQAAGGRGAVRECAELILKAQNKWKTILAGYLAGASASDARQ